MDVLSRIKSLIVHRRFRFTVKAADELEIDELEKEDVFESILNAKRIKKVLRSSRGRGEKLYVIESKNYKGTLIYSKGTIRREAGEEIYYIFISAKRSGLSA